MTMKQTKMAQQGKQRILDGVRTAFHCSFHAQPPGHKDELPGKVWMKHDFGTFQSHSRIPNIVHLSRPLSQKPHCREELSSDGSDMAKATQEAVAAHTSKVGLQTEDRKTNHSTFP